MSDYTEKDIAKFHQSYTINEESGCWEWAKARQKPGPKGAYRPYGFFQPSKNAKLRMAHRASWMIHNGEIPEGMVVRHMCHNFPCCNPSHLAIGTPADNGRDTRERNAQLKREGKSTSRK